MDDPKLHTRSYREKLRKKEIDDLKNEIIKKLPVFDARMRRRYKIPYFDALCQELDEDGCEFSAPFMRMLVVRQNFLRDMCGINGEMWHYPLLITRKKVIYDIYHELREAELSGNAGDRAREGDILINLAFKYSEGNKIWWWMAERIFDFAAKRLTGYLIDGGIRESIARYYYSVFLFHTMQDIDTTYYQLTLCRECCAGKSWNANRIYPDRDVLLFQECSRLLVKTLLILIDRTIKKDPQRAYKLSSIAAKRCKDTNNQEMVVTCYMKFAALEMELGIASRALKKFMKCLNMYEAIDCEVGYCETLIQCCLAEEKLGNMQSAHSYLETLREYALKHEMPKYTSLYYYNLGKLYYNKNNYKMATPIFKKLYEMSQVSEDIEMRDISNVYGAISQAETAFRQYTDLILLGNKNSEALIKLMEWKNHRVPFWKQSEPEPETTKQPKKSFKRRREASV